MLIPVKVQQTATDNNIKITVITATVARTTATTTNNKILHSS
jgi:hypothetical protein